MTISIRMRWQGRTMLALAALSLAAGAVLAQYPGHIDMEQKKEAATTLRAIAVLEWTGDRERPSATRLVPVSLFDGERLQDGGLYLARPVPLALDSGTEYEVESSGVPQGWFDLDGARQVGQDWFGFGKWKPYVPPAPKKPKTAHQQVTVVGSRPADDRPHFKRREDTEASPPGANSSSASADAAKPGNSGGGNSNAASSEPVDPNRPRLRRRAQEKAEQAEAAANAPETPSNQADPDRPRLAHGKPADAKDEPKPLEITPAALGQAVAVSDAERADHQTFAYDWKSPEDAANVKKELETQGAQLLKPHADTVTNTAASAHLAAARTAAQARHRTSAAENQLTDVKFAAFALTYGGGATLVMTAHEAAGPRSIALIGIEDIYGKVQVVWSSITDDTHLDITPLMTLVDAVDPRGDGHADLLFEQRNAMDRRFVLYSVGATSAEQVFATDPLPLHPVTQPGE